jgi:hypothetical protein
MIVGIRKNFGRRVLEVERQLFQRPRKLHGGMRGTVES